jgi:phospholipase C
MPPPLGPIEHVVVLMMENRSFDHMLGYLPREGHLKNFEGLTDTEIKPAEAGGSTSEKFFNLKDPTVATSTKFSVKRGAPYKMEGFARGVGPPHEVSDVNVQLNNTAEGPSTALPATNNGFVRAWADSLHRCDFKPTTDELQRVMECFSPEQLPVLSTLAREFVLCDHWFCSVPGPTMPNRLYVHAATSCGFAHNAFGTQFQCRTIYDNLTDAEYTWSSYHQNQYDLVMDFKDLNHFRHKHNAKNLNYREYCLFKKDVKEGTLAHYSFINLRFIDWKLGVPDNVELANSQHAPCDVRPGEALIAEVYNTLRNSELWKKTLLVILYDEHGGFYDHVAPPTGVPNPDGLISPRQEDIESLKDKPEDLAKIPRFDFTRLGPRVPAILISPLLPRMVDSTVYEHSSLLATVKKLFKLPNFLTQRDANANSFEHLFEGAQLRGDNDTPKNLVPLMPDLRNSQWGQLVDSLKTKVLQKEVPHLPETDRHEPVVQSAARATNAEGEQLLDSVQKEVMLGAISHLPEADRRAAEAKLADGTMTLQQASAFQKKAVRHFKNCVCGKHPRV